MTRILSVLICLGILRSHVHGCDSKDLVQGLYNATLQNNCFQNATSCLSSCISGHVLKDGNRSTDHVCNGTSWSPSTATCLPEQLPVMRTTLTIVYVTGDLPAGSCLYAFNVTLTQYLGNFQSKLQSTCAPLDTGHLTIESLTLSPLAFRITSLFGIKFSGSGTAKSRGVCIDMIEIVSNNDPLYLKPFSVISCGAAFSNISKKSTIKDGHFQYDCSERIGFQLLQTIDSFSCVPCFPGTYWNTSSCEPCSLGTYQPLSGQLNCGICPSGKHVTDDRTECRDSACVSAFLSQSVTGIELACTSETQLCTSTCSDGYIQDDGGLGTTYNCSEMDLSPVIRDCQKYEFSSYRTSFDAVYQTSDQMASTCLSSFRSLTASNLESFQTSISTSCSVHSRGNVTIDNITSDSLAFLITSTFHLIFYGSWPVNSINTCMSYIVIVFQSSVATDFLHPYKTLQCTNGQTNVTKQTATRGSSDVIECSQGRQIINSTVASYCVPCLPGSFLAESVCLPCPNGTYQSHLGQTFCNNCSNHGAVNTEHTDCILDEMTTFANNAATSSTDVTSQVNSTEQSTTEMMANFTTEASITTDLTTTSNNETTHETLTSTTNFSETTQYTMTSVTTEISTSIQLTTTSLEIRTTEGYSIPCSVDQLSSAIPNANHACAVSNRTCTVVCNPGFVTNTGETTVVYTCEGDLWAPQRKLCLEYEVPFSTSTLTLTYKTLDQLAAACLQKFEEITDANRDQFKQSIVDTCGPLGISAGNMNIKNITSSSLIFLITSEILITFEGDETLKARNTCLAMLEVIFTINSLFLHPYSPLNCTSGVSSVSKGSASHMTSNYSCGNNTYLVQYENNLYCVPCPPGMHMLSSQCVPCPKGYYQPFPGQFTCVVCPDNMIVVDGGTNCTEKDQAEPTDTKLGRSQVEDSSTLSKTEIIIVAVVSACTFVVLVSVATICYCKKSKMKRRTSHADISQETKPSDELSIKSDEYLRKSQEMLIPEPNRSNGALNCTYSDKRIEKSTFASENETKALDVLKTIININIDNDECITAEPQSSNMEERKGKWRRIRHKEDPSVSEDVSHKAAETVTESVTPEPPVRSLSDYDSFQIYVPEFQEPE